MAALDGQVGVVTGGGRGIGRGMALSLAESGMAVVVAGRTQAPLDDVVAEISDRGGRGLAVPTDVTVPDDVRQLVRATEDAFGPIDLLVNNAGAVEREERPLWESDLDDLWHVVEVNLRGSLLCAAEVLGGMVERGHGRVVNINSMAAIRHFNGAYNGYGIAKAGLLRMTLGLAASLERTGVSIFELSPGLVRTDMTDGMPVWHGVADDEWTPAHLASNALLTIAEGRCDELSGRFLHAEEDFADLIEFADRITEMDARVLTIRSYGDDDELFGP
jgi:NAD(P)-dependent dehydrogenase (short-subunit alcohol dehydrogenase family)